VVDDTRARLIAQQQFHETWIFVLHPRRRTKPKAEFAIWIGMEEVIARVVHDIDVAVLEWGGGDPIEKRAAVEIGDHNSRPPTIGCKQRRGDLHGRNMWCVDHPTRLFEVYR